MYNRTREYTLLYKGEKVAGYYSKEYADAEQYFAVNLGSWGLTAEQFQSKDCKIISRKG